MNHTTPPRTPIAPSAISTTPAPPSPPPLDEVVPVGMTTGALVVGVTDGALVAGRPPDSPPEPSGCGTRLLGGSAAVEVAVVCVDAAVAAAVG